MNHKGIRNDKKYVIMQNFNKIQNQREICLYLGPILDYAEKTETMGRYHVGDGVYDRKWDLYRKC